MKNKNLIESFNNAINGIIYALKLERNLKIHIAITVIVLIASLFLDISKTEFLILLFTISLVIITEMVNTSIENVVDIKTEEYHPLAKIAKDVSAGAVFVASLNAVIVAYVIFYDKLKFSTSSILSKVTGTPDHIMFISVALVLLSVLVLKSYFNKGTPMHGGMPSGHAALAFGVATAVAFLSMNFSVITLCIILAVLVAQSRIEGKIHSTGEVLWGALLGIIVTVVVFQLRGR